MTGVIFTPFKSLGEMPSMFEKRRKKKKKSHTYEDAQEKKKVFDLVQDIQQHSVAYEK